MYTHIVYIYIYIYICICIFNFHGGGTLLSRSSKVRRHLPEWQRSSFLCCRIARQGDAVSFRNFKSQNFKLRVSNPKNKYAAYVSVLSQISNCQGLGRKKKHEILKTDRAHCRRTNSIVQQDPATFAGAQGADTLGCSTGFCLRPAPTGGDFSSCTLAETGTRSSAEFGLIQ